MSLLEKEITKWFAKNRRDLPWRKTTPWGVLVSEIMLQQTPVARVEPIWHTWMKLWPTPKDLAAATPAQVIKEWGRLGYPRRALRLRECAQVIASDFNNKVPDNEIQLRKLPGIGDYTAAAVMAFAFQERSLVLDINIRRLFSRIYDGVQSPTAAPNKTERAARAELVPKRMRISGQQQQWNSAHSSARHKNLSVKYAQLLIHVSGVHLITHNLINQSARKRGMAPTDSAAESLCRRFAKMIR